MAYAAGATLIVALIAFFNPFSIDEWSLNRSAAVWQRIQADDYGGNHWDRHVAGRDDISIVYLDEKTLASASAASGPFLTLRQHRDMLEDLVPDPGSLGPDWTAPRPAAVFIDIIFANAASEVTDAKAVLPAEGHEDAEATACDAAPAHSEKADEALSPARCYLAVVAKITHFKAWRADPVCQQDSLAKLICILESGGVPILYASAEELRPPGPAKDQNSPRPTPFNQALDLVALTAPAFVSTSNYELVPPSRGGPPSRVQDRLSNVYQLPVASALYVAYCWRGEPVQLRQAAGHARLAKTPNALCPVRPYDFVPIAAVQPPAPPPLSGAMDEVHWNDAFRIPLAVKWGIGGGDPQDPFVAMTNRLHGTDLKARCRPAQPTFRGRIVRLFQEMIPLFHRGDEVDCPFTNAVPYADFDVKQITPADRTLIQDGKIIMVGGQYAQSGDWLAGPTRALPGVYYHAMALDNLIKHREKYPKALLSVIAGSNLSLIAWRTFCAVFVLNLVAGLAIMAMNEPSLDPARLPPDGEASRRRLRRLFATRTGRWLVRIALVTTPILAMAATVTIAELIGKADWLYNFEAAAILVIGVGVTFQLVGVALRPLLEEGRRFFRYFDIADARLLGSDLDPPLQVEPRKTRRSK